MEAANNDETETLVKLAAAEIWLHSYVSQLIALTSMQEAGGASPAGQWPIWCCGLAVADATQIARAASACSGNVASSCRARCPCSARRRAP